MPRGIVAVVLNLRHRRFRPARQDGAPTDCEYALPFVLDPFGWPDR